MPCKNKYNTTKLSNDELFYNVFEEILLLMNEEDWTR